MSDLSTLDADELAAAAETQLSFIVGALDELDRIAVQLADRDALAGLLVELRDVKVAAARVYTNTEQALLGEAGEKSFEVPGIGRVEIKRSTKRSNWRWDELVPVLTAKALTERHYDGEAGEVESEGHAVARVLRDTIGFSYGKVTALRARGIQPDEFCSVDEESWSVQLPARSE